MKNCLAFILILASSLNGIACGFYPYGEQVRFSFIDPKVFDYYSYAEFNYSANLFYANPESVYKKNERQPNDQLWFDYCLGKVNDTAIHEAVYALDQQEINGNSANEMIRYLFRSKDLEAIHYLRFAKGCEAYNTHFDDPWERNEYVMLPKRTQLIRQAVQLANEAKQPNIKARYIFLAIRMGYYNRQSATVGNLYDTYLKSVPEKNIISYWSMYFRALTEIDKPLANFYAAQVFANAPDKRFRIAGNYDTSVPIKSTLYYAKTKIEIANVYLLAGVNKPDKALDCLKQIYANNPETPALGFMMLREINKIEDWVFTPYYSLFSPSLAEDYWSEEKETSVKEILKRVERDRGYAAEVLQFVNSVNSDKIDNPLLWQTLKAQLFFVTRQYRKGLAEVARAERHPKINDSIYNQLQLIKSLSLVANQEHGKAIIPDEIKTIILKNSANKKYLFAIGRELEYKGNTTDAALIYSRLNDDGEYGYGNNAYWKTLRNRQRSYRDYYTNYFEYADVYYNVKQIESLIAAVNAIHDTDDFSQWKFAVMQKEKSRLYDLLGTKYIRQDKLAIALQNFEKVDKGYWNERYSLWDRQENYGNYFDQNPFFILKYTDDFIFNKESFLATKASVTKRLIYYLNRANDKNEKNRDYYYFLVANCYYNMTINGNSWMMRRFYVSDYNVEPFPEDEPEFRNGYLANKYYYLAYKNAKTPEFAALCLRLGNRFVKLKKDYPDDYDRLCDGCHFFADYFKARR